MTTLNTYKDAVKLRTKKLANGSESLYLDIYIQGKRKYEYLKLYLLPGKENKAKNKETMQLANAVKAKRLVDVQNKKFGFDNNTEKANMLLLDYMAEYVDDKFKKKTEGYANDVVTVVNHLKKYVGRKKVTLKSVDRDFCLGFLNHLKNFKRKIKDKEDKALSPGTIRSYYTVFVVAMNKAVRMGILDKNPCDLVPTEDKPKKQPSNRSYLTLDEVRKMIDTYMKDHRVKRAFLFACFTGLRYSDIISITWDNVKKVDNDVLQLEFVQQKTKNPVVVPLNNNAIQWLPERKPRQENIFVLPKISGIHKKLKRWAENAGVEKHVTFHVSRHTYATLLLYYGADLYTVSKLLGHSNINTTQIYAKVMDETKRKAVNLIPQI